MNLTDPIADMLTRIRNANSSKHESVLVPKSNVKMAIAKILLEEGYIKNYQIIEDGKQDIIRIALKYNGKEITMYVDFPMGLTLNSNTLLVDINCNALNMVKENKSITVKGEVIK